MPPNLIGAAAQTLVAREMRRRQRRVARPQRAWYRAAQQEHWQLQSVDAGLDDFGGVDWKGRPLEATIAIIHVRLKNAIVGEYRDGCFKAAHVVDHEFKTIRDPIAVACDRAHALASWQAAHAFRSVWNID